MSALNIPAAATTLPGVLSDGGLSATPVPKLKEVPALVNAQVPLSLTLMDSLPMYTVLPLKYALRNLAVGVPRSNAILAVGIKLPVI